MTVYCICLSHLQIYSVISSFWSKKKRRGLNYKVSNPGNRVNRNQITDDSSNSGFKSPIGYSFFFFELCVFSRPSDEEKCLHHAQSPEVEQGRRLPSR